MRAPVRHGCRDDRSTAGSRRAGVRHVVWSTLEDTRRFMSLDDVRMPTLMGRYKVPHLDAKGEADAILRAHDLPTTFPYTSYYCENLIHYGMAPRRDPEGRLVLPLPLGDRRPVQATRALHPALQDFDAWLATNREALATHMGLVSA